MTRQSRGGGRSETMEAWQHWMRKRWNILESGERSEGREVYWSQVLWSCLADLHIQHSLCCHLEAPPSSHIFFLFHLYQLHGVNSKWLCSKDGELTNVSPLYCSLDQIGRVCLQVWGVQHKFNTWKIKRVHVIGLHVGVCKIPRNGENTQSSYITLSPYPKLCLISIDSLFLKLRGWGKSSIGGWAFLAIPTWMWSAAGGGPLPDAA